MGSDTNQKYQGLESTGKGNELRVWHGGSHANLKTLMYIMPKKKIAVVVMIPANYADRWNIVRKIVDKLGVDRSKSIKKVIKNKCTDDMGSSSKQFVGIWQKTNQNVIIRRGYSSNNFNKEWNFLKKQGYQVFDIEPWKRSNGKTVWDGVFKKAGSGYTMWRNYDYSGFKKKWDEMNKKGFRLYDLETYMIGNKRKWAGLFKKGSDKYAMWRNFSTNDFAKKRTEMSSKGMKLIDIEVYESRGQLKWSGVWLGLGEELLNRNYDTNKFKILVADRYNSGYRLIDLETYKMKGKRKWAGIWEKNINDQKTAYENYCGFMDKHVSHSANKYELIDLEVYN